MRVPRLACLAMHVRAPPRPVTMLKSAAACQGCPVPQAGVFHTTASAAEHFVVLRILACPAVRRVPHQLHRLPGPHQRGAGGRAGCCLWRQRAAHPCSSAPGRGRLAPADVCKPDVSKLPMPSLLCTPMSTRQGMLGKRQLEHAIGHTQAYLLPMLPNSTASVALACRACWASASWSTCCTGWACCPRAWTCRAPSPRCVGGSCASSLSFPDAAEGCRSLGLPHASPERRMRRSTASWPAAHAARAARRRRAPAACPPCPLARPTVNNHAADRRRLPRDVGRPRRRAVPPVSERPRCARRALAGRLRAVQRTGPPARPALCSRCPSAPSSCCLPPSRVCRHAGTGATRLACAPPPCCAPPSVSHPSPCRAAPLSCRYAGTGAMKSAFTRTGKRDIWGLLDDGAKSLTR